MAGTEPAPLRRRFVTRVDVEDAHRAGQDITLDRNDVITHEASQRAADLGVTVHRADRVTRTPAATAAPPSAGSEDRLRAAIRAAVIAELGSEPADLDAVITRVLERRSRA
jgi:hypothetical protein